MRVPSTAAGTDATKAQGIADAGRYRYSSLAVTDPCRPTTATAQSSPYVANPNVTGRPVEEELSPST
jgi:hypothetical protein